MTYLSVRGFVLDKFCECGGRIIQFYNRGVKIRKCKDCGRMWKFNKNTKQWEVLI